MLKYKEVSWQEIKDIVVEIGEDIAFIKFWYNDKFGIRSAITNNKEHYNSVQNKINLVGIFYRSYVYLMRTLDGHIISGSNFGAQERKIPVNMPRLLSVDDSYSIKNNGELKNYDIRFYHRYVKNNEANIGHWTKKIRINPLIIKIRRHNKNNNVSDWVYYIKPRGGIIYKRLDKRKAH